MDNITSIEPLLQVGLHSHLQLQLQQTKPLLQVKRHKALRTTIVKILCLPYCESHCNSNAVVVEAQYAISEVTTTSICYNCSWKKQLSIYYNHQEPISLHPHLLESKY